MHRYEFFCEWTRRQSSPWSLEIEAETGRKQGGRICRAVEEKRCVSYIRTYTRHGADILCNTVVGGGQHGGQLFYQMRPVSRLLQLFYHRDDNVIIDSF